MIDKKSFTEHEGEIIQPSGESLSPEQKVEFPQEQEKMAEREATTEKAITKEALQREIDVMELSDELREEATKKAKKIQTLGQEEKIERLLKIAKDKGIVFAVKMAKQMNDPLVLDTLHDILVKEWATYRQFLK